LKHKVATKVASPPRPPAIPLPSYEDDGLIHGLLNEDEAALEAVLAG